MTSASAVRVVGREASGALELDEVLRAREAGLGGAAIDGAGAGGVRRDGDAGLSQQPDDVAVAVVGRPNARALHPALGEGDRPGDGQDARLAGIGGFRGEDFEAVVGRELDVAVELSIRRLGGRVAGRDKLALVGRHHQRAAVPVRQRQGDAAHLRPSALVAEEPLVLQLEAQLAEVKAIFARLGRSRRGPSGSARCTSLALLGVDGRGRIARKTTIANPITNTAIAKRAIFCQRTLLF